MQISRNFWILLRVSLQSKLQKLSSLRITVCCLFLLFILTFVGTVYQVQHGLYLSQKKFFTSWISLLGPFPIPGAKLVLSVLFVNLLSDAMINFRKRIRKMGLILVHWGILTLLFGSMLLHNTVQESFLSLFEGQISNVSTDYSRWEICLWKNDEHEPYVNGKKQRRVCAVDQQNLIPGANIDIANMGIQLRVLLYFANSKQSLRPPDAIKKYLSATGIVDLIGIPSEKEPSEDFPGAMIVISKGDHTQPALLWGRELIPLVVDIGGMSYCVQLRRKKMVLPVTISLIDFSMEKHPSTEIAKSYSSLVEIQDGPVTRKVHIFMNNPLRIGDRTFYQSSYEIRPEFPEKTVLSVVQSSGRLLLYVSSLVICLGLFLHFIGMIVVKRRAKS